MAGKQQGHDLPNMIAIIAFTVMIVIFMVWLAMHEQISSGIRWLRIGELHIAGLFTDKYEPLIRQLRHLDPKRITGEQVLLMSKITLDFFRYPVGAISLLMAIIAFRLKEKHPYTRRFGLEEMIKEQATAFPYTAPITKFNPLKDNFRMPGQAIPEKLPAFAEALTPEEWVAYHSLPIQDGKIDRDAARRALSQQLGGRWEGAKALPLWGQALFVAFSLKANGKREAGDNFLQELAQAWQPGKGLVLTAKQKQFVKKNLIDPQVGRITEKVAAQHAFNVPAMVHCLYIAREQGGVLAPAQFVWLRAINRNYWYALNNLGRGAVHAEAAGAIGHYRAEKSAGKPIPNPQLDEAVDGVINYLRENYIETFPAKDYAPPSKR